ncbi:MAG TPA: peptidoglycan DD-metalloendopeptidase family protein [Holophaga sp.]|nr:peptidoglycan DD-metalloendopeptidase family protein [Holophaga sp.]
MTNERRSPVVPRMARGAACCLLLAPSPATAGNEGSGPWAAGSDLLAAPGDEAGPSARFTLSREGGGLAVRLEHQGRVIDAALPAEHAKFRLPLGDRARLRDPWATFRELAQRKPLATLGWNLWDGRPTPVRASASGIVLSRRTDPAHGPVVEIDHGSGIRTRYVLNRFGTSSVAPGARVSAGDPIGTLGLGLPDDIPFVHFEILLDTGGGRLVALDPAPFFFTTAGNRALPFASSVLNAAVRAKDQGLASRLLGLGLDPNGKAVDGTRPLEWSVMMRDPGMIRLLVAAGGNKELKTAEDVGTLLEGGGPTIANTGPSIAESAQETGDPEVISALEGR